MLPITGVAGRIRGLLIVGEVRALPRKLVFFLAIVLLMTSVGMSTAQAKPSDDDPSPIIIDRTDYPVLYPSTPNLQGEAVWMLQARLQELGYDVDRNGQYNANTWGAVSMYQVAHGWEDNATVTQPIWESSCSPSRMNPVSLNKSKMKPPKTLIEIDVAKLNLTLYENDEVVVTYPVAVGKSSTPTPLGEWKIIHKSLNWETVLGLAGWD